MSDIHIRFPDAQLHDAIIQSAKHNRRSLNNEILRAIEFYLKEAPETQYEVKPVKEVTKKKSKSP